MDYSILGNGGFKDNLMDQYFYLVQIKVSIKVGPTSGVLESQLKNPIF